MQRHGGRTEDRGSAANAVAPAKAGSAVKGRTLELQAEIGNRSLAALYADGNAWVAAALANRMSIGNHAVQRFIAPPSAAVAAARRQLAGRASVATATVTSAALNVRGGASASAAKVGELRRGAKVDVVGKSGPWLRVRFGGEEGWISSRFVKIEAAPATGGLQGGPAPSFFGAFGNAAAVLGEELRDWWRAATGEKAAEAAADVPAANPQLTDLLSKPTLSASEIDKARALIDAEKDETRRGDLYEALQAKTPYFSQRDNQATEGGAKVETASGNMCNLTSLAMSLSYLGVANPRPQMQFEDALEKIRQEKGFGARTTADGWGKLANELGVTYDFIGIGVMENKQWWVTNVLPHLRQGKAVMLSISGHICRLQAVTDDGLVADDPYGASRLLAGGEHKWTFKKKNAPGKPGQLAGNDVLWPWADVAKHTMKWVAAFKK